MKLSELNEYIQSIAALGAIIALIAVGYEIRQGNRIASQQAASVSWIQWIEAASSDLESGVSRVRAKAALSPEELTLQDKMELDLWHQRTIYVYSHDYFVLIWEADSDAAEGILIEVEADAPVVFGSRFSRAWLRVNKDWIPPELFETIERGLEGAPTESELDYYGRIDALAATLE
jgi:hypothetical protein